MTVEPLLLTPSDVAARLGTSVDSVRRMIRAGQLGSVRAPKARRVPVAELERYLTAVESAAPTPIRPAGRPVRAQTRSAPESPILLRQRRALGIG